MILRSLNKTLKTLPIGSEDVALVEAARAAARHLDAGVTASMLGQYRMLLGQLLALAPEVGDTEDDDPDMHTL